MHHNNSLSFPFETMVYAFANSMGSSLLWENKLFRTHLGTGVFLICKHRLLFQTVDNSLDARLPVKFGMIVVFSAWLSLHEVHMSIPVIRSRMAPAQTFLN